MEILVHKGTHEIGGTCIQVSSGKTTILLDVGLPLSSDSPIVDVAQLKVDAVLISHAHQDHFGLMNCLPPNTPVYMGRLGKNLIDATQVFLGKSKHEREFRHFKAWEPFEIGEFRITPYLVDHSATDAYSFLVEAEGKRLFYSGDLRSHGRKGILFENLLKRPIPRIDIMFLEGTMMHRNNDLFPDEEAVEKKIVEVISQQKNISFILSSSQNIDRIVSAYRACKRTGKILVIDIYTAWVLEQMRQTTPNTPAMDWSEIRVFATHSQDERLKANPDYFEDFRKRLYCHRVKSQELQSDPSAFLYFGKVSSFRKIEAFKKAGQPVNVIYSQWLGYLDGSHADYFGCDKISAYREDPDVNFVYAHTSGHAPVEDLQRLAAALKPRVLIPVHTEDAAGFRRNFENVTTLMDGETFVLTQSGGLMPEIMSAECSWERYITKRGELLDNWSDDQKKIMKQLAEKWIYIRVGGDKYRPVSIHPDNPCGSLLNRLNGSEREIGGTKSLDTALKNAEAAVPANAKKPGNKKPEHVVQAGLIHHALTHDMLLNDRFRGFSEFFDELIFITDELKAGDIRADIIALGGKGGRYFPVFIELKGIRSFKRVLEQLRVAQQETAKVKSSFVAMLEKGTGKTGILFDEYKLLVVWPKAQGKGIASAAKAVAAKGFESVEGHLLLGEFNITKVVRDGFNSVVEFGESA
jgi:ribonuclease J